jgi:signal transduction histidine kinase
MPQHLDYRTLFVSSGIVGSALLMLLVTQARKPYPGFLRVIIALNALTAGIIAADLRGYVPDALWTLQVAAILCFALIDSGVRLFCAAPLRGLWPYIYVGAAILLLTVLLFTQPLHQRIVFTSLLSIPIFVDTALPLLKRPPKGRWFGYRFTAIVVLSGCIVSCIRIVAVSSAEPNDSPYFSESIADTAFFVMVLFLLLSMAFGFITLAHERLVADLKSLYERFIAEREERLRVERELADERVLAERELARAERLAAVGRLAGGVAHFFNNQMHVIQLACSLLRHSLSASGPLPLTIEEIEKASKRSAEITKRLQQFAQIRVLRSSEVDLRLLLDGIIPELRTIAGYKIDIVNPRSAQVSAVELDPETLKETILALVRNARDAMPAGGKLTISLREEELEAFRAKQLGVSPSTFVVLSVTDTGSGMDEETLRHIFEPFFTTKSMATVEGLGLASIYGFLQQSGGAITVRSAPNQGSTFELYFPRAHAIQHQIAV